MMRRPRQDWVTLLTDRLYSRTDELPPIRPSIPHNKYISDCATAGPMENTLPLLIKDGTGVSRRWRLNSSQEIYGDTELGLQQGIPTVRGALWQPINNLCNHTGEKVNFLLVVNWPWVVSGGCALGLGGSIAR